MLRKKLCKMLAALMVSTIVLGNSVQAVGATVVETIASEGENQGNVLADGTYKITNKTLQKGTDNNSAIRNYIDTNSIVTVKDGKITVTMKYNENGLETVKSTNSITVDGQEIEFKNNEDGSISFEISSIDTLYTRVKINLTYIML